MCDTVVEDCSICLKRINNDDLKQKTPCEHTFHTACLSRWTQANNFCPLCRTPIHLTIQTRQDVINASQNGIYIPLPFWFNRGNERLAIPEEVFEHTMKIAIDISFAELSDLIIVNDNEINIQPPEALQPQRKRKQVKNR